MTTEHSKPVIVPSQGHQTLMVFGIPVEVLLTGEQTNGACSAYRITTQPGDGPPPHIHLYDDESFYVLDGEFEILCGEETFGASAGSFVFLPRATAHTFRNVGTTTGRLLGIGTPPGHERFFYDAALLCMPPNPQEALAVCLKNGIELLPPPA